MPLHDWTRVDTEIFHAFHHGWSSALGDLLNAGLLPDEYYALAQRQPAGFGPNRLVIQRNRGDNTVAALEIVSPVNKCSKRAFRAFVYKVVTQLECRIATLTVDIVAPAIGAPIWEAMRKHTYDFPAAEPPVAASYDCRPIAHVYIEAITVGEALPDMPLSLDTDLYIQVPLEAAYKTAYAAMPARWREVLELGGQQ
jgi:hypothetical protein